MALTKTERALLANQNRILSFLDESHSEHYLFKAEIAENGYEGLYHELFDNIHEEISEEVCNETHEILTMYRFINNFIATLTLEQRGTLNLESISFEGFDANNDKHYYLMEFMVEKADLYDEYRETDLNSHTIASLGKYRRMLLAYRRAIGTNHNPLNLAGLQAIIAAV